MNHIEICNKLGFDWKIRKNRYMCYLPCDWKLAITRDYIELWRDDFRWKDFIIYFHEFIKDIFTYIPELIPSFHHLLYEPDGIEYNKLFRKLL